MTSQLSLLYIVRIDAIILYFEFLHKQSAVYIQFQVLESKSTEHPSIIALFMASCPESVEEHMQ